MLTEAEKKAIRQAGQLYTHIVREIIGDGPTRQADCAELAMHIHGIQHAIMAQAAARTYPETYRLLGGSLNPERNHEQK